MITSVEKSNLKKAAGFILRPIERWKQNCHEASLVLVKAGVGTRVARGFCKGVVGQHSWVVLGDDCYARDAVIIDPTLWSYDQAVRGIWIELAAVGKHFPHGSGSIWNFGKPTYHGGTVIGLNHKYKLSGEAIAFLSFLGALDIPGWITLLSSAPVGGWPAKEIITAAYGTEELRQLIPIDRVGMVTDLNPGGLYLK